MQRGTLSAVFRRVPFEFPSLDDWGMPPVLSRFATLPRACDPHRSHGIGKSSHHGLLRVVVTPRARVTIEDPIEFLLKDGLGALTQRG